MTYSYDMGGSVFIIGSTIGRNTANVVEKGIFYDDSDKQFSCFKLLPI